MGVLDGGGDHQRGRGSFGVNFGRPIVTDGDFAMRLFPNYVGQYLLSKVKDFLRSQAVTY